MAAHAHLVDRNRRIRNKTIAHSVEGHGIAANYVEFEVIEPLTALGVTLFTKINQTMTGKPYSFEVPFEWTLEHFVELHMKVQ